MTDEKSDDEESSTSKKKKPFKLCFAPENLIGRSNIQIGKPLKMAAIITPKFYRQDAIEQHCSDADLKKYIEYLNVKGPKEKYTDPITENQRYGWYQEVRLTDMDFSDRRLHFAKQTNPIIKEHLMNYENIR